jgi:hypothetical protein
MDEVTKLLHAPVFWICTGIGSVTFNVISHYLIRGIEKLATLVGLGSSRLVRRYRLRYMKRVARLNRFVRRHPYGIPLFLHRSDTAKFTALGALVIAATLFIRSLSLSVENPHTVGPAIAGWTGMAYIVIGMAFASRSFQLERLFHKSRYFYADAPSP